MRIIRTASYWKSAWRRGPYGGGYPRRRNTGSSWSETADTEFDWSKFEGRWDKIPPVLFPIIDQVIREQGLNPEEVDYVNMTAKVQFEGDNDPGDYWTPPGGYDNRQILAAQVGVGRQGEVGEMVPVPDEALDKLSMEMADDLQLMDIPGADEDWESFEADRDDWDEDWQNRERSWQKQP